MQEWQETLENVYKQLKKDDDNISLSNEQVDILVEILFEKSEFPLIPRYDGVEEGSVYASVMDSVLEYDDYQIIDKKLAKEVMNVRGDEVVRLVRKHYPVFNFKDISVANEIYNDLQNSDMEEYLEFLDEYVKSFADTMEDEDLFGYMLHLIAELDTFTYRMIIETIMMALHTAMVCLEDFMIENTDKNSTVESLLTRFYVQLVEEYFKDIEVNYIRHADNVYLYMLEMASKEMEHQLSEIFAEYDEEPRLMA